MASYCVRMPYAEFRYNMVETDESGPWGDNYFSQTFNKYVDDGMIEIEYKYGPCVNWKTEIIWKIPETEKAYKLRYGHSSPFAMWWCGLTDEIEEEEEETVCVDSCECENNSDNWNHCAECSHKCCDLGPNAEEGWTYDEDKEVWLCPDCCEGSEK